MKTITVELMQHTPMIHFQVRYDQTQTLREQRGATLRASEVKPKLDRYLMNKLGNKLKREWLVGSGTHDALDYKMKIVADDGDGTASVVQLPRPTSTYNPKNNKTKWKADFPMLLANLMGGGQENIEDLRFLSMHKKVTMYIYLRAREVKDEKTGEKHLDDTWYKELEENLREFLPEFFATTNFGQRSNKGFGSFTVNSIDDGETLYGEDYADKSLFMDYCLGKNFDVYSLEVQKRLFTVIDFFWIELTHHIYKDEEIDLYNVTDTNSYIKVMAKYNLNQDRKNHDKLRLNADVKRLPAPILFKPIFFLDEDGKLWFSVFIMMDCNMIQSLRKNLGKSTKKVTKDKNIILHIGSKEDWNINYIYDDFVYKDFTMRKWEKSFKIFDNKQNRSKGRAIGNYKVVFFSGEDE